MRHTDRMNQREERSAVYRATMDSPKRPGLVGPLATGCGQPGVVVYFDRPPSCRFDRLVGRHVAEMVSPAISQGEWALLELWLRSSRDAGQVS